MSSLITLLSIPFTFYSVGRFVFDASVAALINERAGADPTLYPAFTVFDSYLPLAIAGLSVTNIKVS